jgi:serine/threonine-protein kinase PRP4
MKRSGKKEVKILRRLNESDPLGKCFCMKLEDSFEEHGHLCLVFEALDMNLTEVIKMYGHHVGLHIKAVRSYAFKLFKALSLLKKCNVIHADIKPDNVLVSKDRNTVKLADFGTAFESQEATLTTQLVSRFYRAPEIVIGMAHSFPLDMFSMGCCLYELATGRYLLPSTDENHHLKLIMELQGPFSKKMLSACHTPFLEQHFTMDGTFLERYADPLDPTRIMVRRVEMPQKATRDLAKELFQSYGPSLTTDVEVAWVNRLADLINRCLTLDPRKRITPEEALSHGFF